MNAANDNTARGMWAWWLTPQRSGWRRVIAPWEYRHLRAFASVRIGLGFVLAGLAAMTLSVGSYGWKTYAWTALLLAAALAELSFAYWELAIARSAAARTT